MKIAALTLVLGLLMNTGWAYSADLAKVNGKAITEKDMEAALSGIPEAQRQTILKDANSKRQILNGLVEQELLAQAAERERLDQSADFKTALESFKKQYLSNNLLQKDLGPQVTEKAEKKYYEQHKSRYSTDMVHAQHILLPTEEQARELLKKAKAPNADFQELAEKYSKDPSAKNNRGDLGFFGRDRMVPEFTEPAFAASEGDVIGPVKTGYGYHIIKIIKRKFGKVMPFADVQLKVQNDLRQELAQNFVAKLRKDAKVEFNDRAIDGK